MGGLSITDKKIIKILKKAEGPLSKSEVARRANLTTATISKYIDVLAAKGVIKLSVYGNIHLVELEGGQQQ